MSFEKLVEEKIRAAMEAGEFDNLEGAGLPLALDEYFATPEDLRVAFSVLKNARVLPREVELLKEIESLRSAIAGAHSSDDKVRLGRELNDRLLQYEVIMDRYRRTRKQGSPR
jgi:hypothetical protein